MTDDDLDPYELSWSEADPRSHPFDAASALAEVTAFGPANRVPARPEDEDTASRKAVSDWSHDVGEAWSQEMTWALVERFGRWTVGGRWARHEGALGGGGPVGAWCCPLHSISTPAETLDKVAAALCEWRSWLEELADYFDRYPLDSASAEERRDAWPRGTVRLVTRVVDRTLAHETWYEHCRVVLTWFLTRWGVDARTARVWVENAIYGRFESWTVPEREAVNDVVERLSTALLGDG